MLDQNKLDQVVDEVAGITSRNVSLDDVFSRVLAYNTSHPTTDRARIESVLMKSVSAEAKIREAEFHLATQTRPFVMPANPELGFLARVCIPLVYQGLKAGYLWILVRDEDDPAEPILEAVLALGDRIEQYAYTVLEAIEPVTQESVAKEKALLAALRGTSRSLPDWLNVVLQTGPVQIALLSHPALLGPTGIGAGEQATVLRQAMSESLRAVRAHVAWAPGEGFAVSLLSQAVGAADLKTISTRFGQSVVLHGLKSRDPDIDALVGLSAPVTTGNELATRFNQSLVALQAGIVDPALPRPTSYDQIGIYQFLAQPGTKPASTRMSAIAGAPNGEELLTLLEQVYDSDKPRNDLAAELHMHRTSLYHRLRRIGKIIGDDPLTSSIRLDLHLGLKSQRWARRPKFGSWESAQDSTD